MDSVMVQSVSGWVRSMKTCPNCGRKVVGHKNKKFCGQRCKDHYHNRNNPRGYGSYDRYYDDEIIS